MSVTPATLIAVAQKHYGEPAGINTCVSHGAFPWSVEAGLPIENKAYSAADIDRLLGSNQGGPKYVASNVTGFVAYAREGNHGWSVISATDAQPGDFMIWKDYSHISLFVDGNIRTIGAGGPTGKVFQQPQGGGSNSRSTFIMAIRPPYATLAQAEANAAQQAAAVAAANASIAAAQEAAAKDAQDAAATKAVQDAADAEKLKEAQDAAVLAAAQAAQFAKDQAAHLAEQKAAEEAAATAAKAAKIVPPVLTDKQVANAANEISNLANGKVTYVNQIIARIRTWVPVGIGALLTWLSTLIPSVGVFFNSLSPDTKLGVYTVATALVIGLYYWIAQKLAKRWPTLGYILIGSNKSVDYRFVGN